ncbi:MAG: hypothetical protein H6702_01055 [Myxococcales bacterium]|nr:hypothetical protein [Myxococcales bacterium]
MRRLTLPLLCLTCGLLAALPLGCSDDPVPADLRIDRVLPAEVAPGRAVIVEGGDFGDAQGSVAIGGRPVPVRRWRAGAVEVVVPADQPRGQTLVVLTTAARARSNAAPLTVLGDGERPDPVRRFPDLGGARDAGPPTDDGPPPRDEGPPLPDEGPRDLVAVFTPDPSGTDAVALVPVQAPTGFLGLQITVPRRLVPQTGGLALHLAYDPNLLTLAEAEPEESNVFIAREIGPGRLALVRVRPEQIAATLIFRLVGRGEARVDVPARHRALRDLSNRDLTELRWAGGSVRVQELGP